MDRTYTFPSDLTDDAISAIFSAVEKALYRIGATIDRDARRAMLQPNQYGGKYIYDRGDFYQAASYVLERLNEIFILRVGSNVAHEPFVLGGKVPSWTPIAPLISWVERKNLNWTDKKTGLPLKIEQMAYMIQAKIHREGIQPRNIYQSVIDQLDRWIDDQIMGIEVSL